MKKFFIVSLSAALFLGACSNDGSSTVGTYERDEVSESTEGSEHGTGEGHDQKETEGSENEGHAIHDTTGIMNELSDSLR
jgi:hypothetical protein